MRPWGPSTVGEMLNEFSVAELALADMVRLNANHGFEPGLTLTDVRVQVAEAEEPRR